MRNYGKALVAAVFVTQTSAAAAVATPIDEYVDGLHYDPRVLLAVTEPGSTENPPARTSGRDGVIICTSKPQGLTEELDKVTILSPLSGVVYPGALVRANRALAEGKPDLISIPRAPMKISVDLPGIGSVGVRTVANPTFSSTQTAITKMLDAWTAANGDGKGYVNAAYSTYNVQKAYSQTQLALGLGLGTKWSSNSLSSTLKVNSNSENSTTVALFRQVFYRVTFDAPPRASAVFAPDVTASDLRRVLDDADPPAYVRSVDYGRIILVRMDTSSAATEAELEAAMNLVTQSGTEVNGETKNKARHIAEQSKFTVLTLGGNAEVATQVVDPRNLDKIADVIHENSVFSRNNPGFPIAYTVAFLKDNSTAIVTFSTSYTRSDCVSYPNGYVRLQNSGGYVARFNVQWSEKGADGQQDQTQSWSSGNTTAGWRATRDLPGDATKVRIKAEVATGLAWQPWNEALNTTLNGPDNKCYRITGTTLSPHWDNDC